MKKTGIIKAIKLCRDYDKMNCSQKQAVQQQRLAELIAYAKENSPYYKNLYSHIPEKFTLTDLPVTDKKTLMANWNDLISAIKSSINSNGNNLITGKVLQDALIEIVNTIGNDITSERIADGAVTRNKLSSDAIPDASNSQKGLMTKEQVVLLTQLSDRNYPGGIIIGTAHVGSGRDFEIYSQSWNIYIEDPFSAPQEVSLSDVTQISESSILLSIRGGFIAYDSEGGIVAADLYSRYLDVCLRYDPAYRSYYFDPVPGILSGKGVKTIAGCIIIEWV